MIRKSAATRLWRKHGRDDPYFAVCTLDAYHRGRMDAAAREAFFASGAAHVDAVLSELRRCFDPDFRPRRALDFGSGVGRLAIPLAGAAGEVVGVDVAPEMNAEAERNCAERGITNARFVLSDDALTRVDGSFDLVHSYIVLQHIPPRRGKKIFAAMLDRLEVGGLGAVHFTYGRRGSLLPLRRAVNAVRRGVPFANAAANVLQGRPARAPLFPLYEYGFDRMLGILRGHGVGDLHVALLDHGGHLGAMLFFRKGGGARVG
jgi:SAM-dependent methyltransferase